jgi:hypothetical protein
MWQQFLSLEDVALGRFEPSGVGVCVGTDSKRADAFAGNGVFERILEVVECLIQIADLNVDVAKVVSDAAGQGFVGCVLAGRCLGLLKCLERLKKIS